MQDVLNVVVLEFGWGVGWLTVSAIVVMLIMVLGDGVWGVPGCVERRAARKKKEHVRLMRGMLQDFGHDMKRE